MDRAAGRDRDRADLLSWIGLRNEKKWATPRAGDSGRPVFIRWNGHDVPVTQFFYVNRGPSIPAAAKMLRAYCAQHGCAPKSLPKQ